MQRFLRIRSRLLEATSRSGGANSSSISEGSSRTGGDEPCRSVRTAGESAAPSKSARHPPSYHRRCGMRSSPSFQGLKSDRTAEKAGSHTDKADGWLYTTTMGPLPGADSSCQRGHFIITSLKTPLQLTSACFFFFFLKTPISAT